MLKATGIYKSYGQVAVLKGVNITLQAGEVVALVGASGAGKSTLLQVLGTLDEADAGSVQFEGQEVTRMNERQKAAFRNHSLGFVFQFHHLLPEFSALENVCMPAWIAGQPRYQAMQRAQALLERLGLAHRVQHKPAQLSGGEQQRVSVARALINTPRIILADEPTGNLDTANSEELFQLMFELAKSMGICFLVATHNLALADRADRVCHIKDGVILD
ncbi:MAG: ABC transporter ATP-binding protein [Bacteroidia bacterium]|nr:ABC transporter ATP-binding protein [Bacteroidia bacterium]